MLADSVSPILTITGSNFLSGAMVRMGNTAILTTAVSATRITAVVPQPLVYGRYPITVVNPPPSAPSNTIDLEILPVVPVITSINPPVVPQGQTIQVVGRYFGPASVIQLRSGLVIPTTFLDATTLTGVLPAAVPLGPNEVLVVNPGLTPLVSSGVFIDVVSPGPAITSYTPQSGVTGSTVSFIVDGTGFLSGAEIQINGSPILTTFVNSTRLAGTATLGAVGTVSLTVLNPDGSISSPVPFTITATGGGTNPTPTISGIFPGGALVGAATLSLNISGTGFIGLSSVTFGGTAVTITAQTPTLLTVTIPASLMTTGGSRAVVVTNPGPGGGSATTAFVVNSFDISPIFAERIPGGTQQFTLLNAPAGTFIWSVNGVDGGDTTFGTVTPGGFYTAPSTVPSPATFPLCARLSTNSAVNACATVLISLTPSAGGDLVVFNDVNPFDNTAMLDPNNLLMARNLVNFTGAGPRASGNVVQFDCGRNSAFGSICTSATAMIGEMTNLGLTVTTVNSTGGTLTNIPANVKAIFLWLPTVAFTPVEVNTLKTFANTGGRIVFIGEHAGFYGTSIPLQNDFLTKMGAVMRNIGQVLDPGYTVLPSSRLSAHQITANMTQVTIAASSVITLGPNDFPLYYSLAQSTAALAGVAKINVSLLPSAGPTVTSVSPASGPIGTATNVTITGTNFIETCTGCPANFGTNIQAGANVVVSNIVYVDSTTITATFTPGFNAALGANAVTAITQVGSGGGATFTVTPAGAPTIATLSPNVGAPNSSVAVTITGTNFTAGATVALSGSGITAGTPVVTSSTSITVQLTIAANAPIGNQSLTVTAGGGTSNALTFFVTPSIVFPGFTKTWLGGQAGATNDFQTAGNWQPAGVPGPTDDVFIPLSAPHQPVLNGLAQIDDLYVEPGASLTINLQAALNASGSVSAGTTINGPGVLQMSGTSKFLDGIVDTLSITGTVSGMGNVTVLNTMVVSGTGNYTVNGKNLDVRGAFLTTNTATLTMTNANDYVQVGGQAVFSGGSTTGKLTSGALELKDGFAQTNQGGANDSFAASGSHITRFVGSIGQNIDFFSAGTASSHFQNVEIQNAPSGSVLVNTFPALALGRLELKTASSILTGTNSFTANGDLLPLAVGAQISIANLTIGGNVDGVQPIGTGLTILTMSGTGKTLGGTINGYVTITGTVTANTAVTISRGLTINGGMFDVGAFVVTVAEDLSTSGNGVLQMISSFASLSVRDATFAGGSTAGKLTAGTLTVGRDFAQSGPVGNAFAASGSHTVAFNGGGTIQFASPGSAAGTSQFQNLLIQNTGRALVTVIDGPNVNPDVVVAGDLTVNSGAGLNAAGTVDYFGAFTNNGSVTNPQNVF